jgi:hypothetical protein
LEQYLTNHDWETLGPIVHEVRNFQVMVTIVGHVIVSVWLAVVLDLVSGQASVAS